MANAYILSIGDELLIGQTINTNASYLGKKLAEMGVKVIHQASISDNKEAIKESITHGLKLADIILITGGLGPTKDDITKHVLVEYFGGELVINQEILEHITSFFTARNRPMLDVNIQQAALPSTCKSLFNAVGTAAGMLFEKDGKIVVSMPGVPYEMKRIMEDHVFNEIRNRFNTQELVQKTLLIQGIGESFLAKQIEEWENKVRSEGFDLAYLPSPGLVKIRLSSLSGNKKLAEIEKRLSEVEQLLPKHAFGWEEDNLAEVLSKLIHQNNEKICFVESCTGGAMVRSITNIAGASEILDGSIVSYAEKMKEQLMQVPQNKISEYGVVSEEVALLMAQNGRKVMKANYCISTTGIAGPTGGTEKNPVGTIWIGISTEKRTFAKRFQFGDNRERNIQMCVLTALNLLRCEILGLNS